MASLVQIKVELGLTIVIGGFVLGTSHPPASLMSASGGDVLTDSYNWTDIAPDIDEGSLSWSRGATRSAGPWFRYESGRCSFTLDNNGGGDIYNPLNTTGPYSSGGVPQIRPGIPIKITLVYATFPYVVFRGWIDTWQPANNGTRWSSISVTATDGVERLQAANGNALATPVGAGENAGARINRILDAAGWSPTLRDIDVSGDITMQATSLAQPAWSEMLLTADSAAGYLFISAEGMVTYKERNSIPFYPTVYYNPLTSPSITTDIDEDIVLSYDRQQVINQVKLARAGGIQQYVSDDVSASDFNNGQRTHSRSDLICETDDQVQTIAQWVLFYYSELRYRVEQITVPMLWGDNGSLEGQWTLLAWQEITDRVRLILPQPNGSSLDQQAIIRGISVNMGPNNSARMTLSLQQAPTYQTPFTLGAGLGSLLGSTDVLTPF